MDLIQTARLILDPERTKICGMWSTDGRAAVACQIETDLPNMDEAAVARLDSYVVVAREARPAEVSRVTTYDTPHGTAEVTCPECWGETPHECNCGHVHECGECFGSGKARKVTVGRCGVMRGDQLGFVGGKYASLFDLFDDVRAIGEGSNCALAFCRQCEPVVIVMMQRTQWKDQSYGGWSEFPPIDK